MTTASLGAPPPPTTGRLHGLRERPYRLFFPLGAAIGAVGVSHWLLYVLRVQEHYSGQGHSLIQLQGFLPAFACGFLLTMLPRRTGTAPPGWPLLLSLTACLVVTAAASITESWRTAEVAFAVLLLALATFTGPRLAVSRKGRPAPDAFVLIPIGLAGGLVGAVLLGGVAWFRLGQTAAAIGRGLVQEGTFTCLVLGVGALLLPVLTGTPVPPDANPGRWAPRLAHAAAGLAIIATFPVQHLLAAHVTPATGTRWGEGLRAAVIVAVLVASLRAHRWPRRPGTQRRLAWLSFWLVPAGMALAAVSPAHRVAFLHVTFVGGFGLMVFSVACHVTLGHGGREDLRDATSWPVRAFGLLFVASMATRVSCDFLVESYWVHVGAAAALWLAGLATWSVYLLPRPRSR